MKTIKYTLLATTLVIGLIPQHTLGATTVQGTVPGSTAVLAIGSLQIRGVEYDVSFDGSFGEMIFLGEPYDLTFDAGEAIRSVINQLWDQYGVPYKTAGAATNTSVDAGSGTYFRVTSFIRPLDDPEYPGRHEFYQAEYAAGWIASGSPSGFTTSSGPPVQYGEATFRLAIPGSIPHTIPEINTCILLALSIPCLLWRSRNRAF